MRRRSTTDGYLTVLLSLTVAVFLSLILAFFASARMGAAKMRAECVTEIAAESALAEYNRALFDRYDLLAVDMSYGGAVADVSRTEERIRHYAQTNLSASDVGAVTDTSSLTGLYCKSVTITSHTRLTDGNCAVLRRQILEYMTAEPVEGALQEATKNLDLLRARGYDTLDVEKEMDENYARLQQALANNDLDESAIDTPAIEVQKLRARGVLALTHPNPAKISRASVTLKSYSSQIGFSRGNGYDGTESLSVAERGLIDQYLFEKCANYTAPKDGARLQYQIEYLIAGKSGDYANIETVAQTLLFWREASNFTYIMTDRSKCALAGALATAAAFLLLAPEIEEPLKLAILFSWSFAESVADVRGLFEGGRVPIVKTRDTWKLTFSNILNFSGARGETGLNYEEYLRMLLLTVNLDVKTKRFADIVEMDLRETPGNLNFRIDGCLDCFTVKINIANGLGFDGAFIRKRGYETKNALE